MSNGNGVKDTVVLHGRITIDNSDEIRTALGKALREKPRLLRVDLSDVSYIDTSAIATLVEAAGIARKQGNQMTLEGLRDQPRYLLETTHLNHLFDVAGQEASQ